MSEKKAKQSGRPSQALPEPLPFRPPKPIQAIDAAEAIAMAASLAEMVQTAGWHVYMAMLERYQVMVPAEGIRDKEHPREYWEGYLDCLDAIKGAVEDVIARGEEAKQATERGERLAGFRLGRGPAAT